MMQAGWLSKYSMRWPWPLLTPQRVPHHGAALFLLQTKNLKTHLAEAEANGKKLAPTAQQPTTSKLWLWLWQEQTKSDNDRY